MTKKISILILSALMMILSVFTVSAKESPVDNKNINTEITTLEELEKQGKVDYYNSKTGEYFLWNYPSSVISTRAAGDIAKTFSFKIMTSVRSSSFVVNSTGVDVKLDRAQIVNQDGIVVSGYDGYKYHIDFYGSGMLTGKTLDMYINQRTTGTLSGFKKGSSYTLEVRNSGTFNDAGVGVRYLSGSGKVVLR